MKFKPSYIAYLLILFTVSQCNPRMIPDITPEEMSEHINYLASDELKGRAPGTVEDSLVQRYVARHFQIAGLKKFNEDYLQYFTYLSGISPSKDNSLVFKGESFDQERDFYPMSFSSEADTAAPVIFCGYGFDLESDNISRNDYINLDPSGKWALILLGQPGDNEEFSSISERDKAMKAMEKGAIGVLFVAGPSYSMSDELHSSLVREPEIDIPVIQITRSLANTLLRESGKTIEELEKLAESPLAAPSSKAEELQVKLALEKVYQKTANIYGYLEGKENEGWMIIGAHHDHLGMGGPGNSSRAPDTLAVHNGADDNASGVATVLELAEYFSSDENRTSSGLIFVGFGAEEKGLLGSKYFVENPPVAHESIRGMFNIDMLGRMKSDSSLQIGGVGTSAEGKDLIDQVNQQFNLNLAISEAGYGPSDHAAFYAENIPVFFFSTGAHDDYHTPWDDPDSLNYHGLATGAKFIASLIEEADKLETGLSYREAGPKRSTSRSFRNMVTLGIMPDVSGSGDEGMEVLAVTAGKPADLGGMKKGDVITGIEGRKVENVYDYMYRLKQLKPGDQIIVSVRRNDENIDLLIQL